MLRLKGLDDEAGVAFVVAAQRGADRGDLVALEFVKQRILRLVASPVDAPARRRTPSGRHQLI